MSSNPIAEQLRQKAELLSTFKATAGKWTAEMFVDAADELNRLSRRAEDMELMLRLSLESLGEFNPFQLAAWDKEGKPTEWTITIAHQDYNVPSDANRIPVLTDEARSALRSES